MRTLALANAALPLLLLAAGGCAGREAARPAAVVESRAERARPEADPTSRATPQGARAISGIERVVVKLEAGPGGAIRVVDFLSPDLTEAEKQELRRAIEGGELAPETGPQRAGTTWTTTVVRGR